MEPAVSASQENVAPAADADTCGMNPKFLADRRLAEDFAVRVVEAFGDHCVAAVFLPWSAGIPPPGVVQPTSTDGTLDMQQVEEVLRGKSIIVIGCTFSLEEERCAASNVVKQFLQVQGGMCILAAHLIHPSESVSAYTRSNYDYLMEVHQAINELGVDDVLLDPEWEPARLKLRIRMAQHSWSINQERLQSMLAEEPQPPPPEEVEALEATQRQLLWEDIPRELMPHFKAMTTDLQETDTMVGEYTLTEQMNSQCGVVWEAKDQHNRKIAIKIIQKADVFTPGEVEGIYREFRFLAGFTRHPNIVRALDCFHDPKKIYTVMEFGGKQNLAQHLSNLPGLRMNETYALETFFALASATAHCHERDVSHRSISLEHVVMKAETDGRHTPRLVDFRSAMIAKGCTKSVAICGSLPCMAPEVLSAGPYMPKAADCWSLGVLLLEMAGGMGSFFRATQIEEAAVRKHPSDIPNRSQLANSIGTYFSIKANHRAALSCMGGLQSNEVLEILRDLLQPEDHRTNIDKFLTAPDDPPAEVENAETTNP